MSVTDIQKSVQSVIEYFTENPDKAHSQDKPATAVLEDGLRCRVDWNGQATIITDMSKALEAVRWVRAEAGFPAWR